MPLMQWTRDMSVGLPELDDDHKQLIAIINQLADESEEGDLGPVIRQGLTALRRYAEFHFAREESVMRASGYPQFDRHRRLHESFVADVNGMADRFEEDPETFARELRGELLTFLKDWLKHHILVEDMAYRPCVEDNRVEATRAAQSFRAAHVWWSS